MRISLHGHSSLVSVKSRHDYREGMKDGNCTEGRSSESSFPPEEILGAQDSLFLTLSRAALQSPFRGDLHCAPNSILIFTFLSPSEMYLGNSLSEAEEWWLILETLHFEGGEV